MQIKKVEHDYTWSADFFYALFVYLPIVVIWMAVGLNNQQLMKVIMPPLLSIGIVIAVVIFARKYLVDKYLKKRGGQMKSIAETSGYQYFSQLKEFTETIKDTDVLHITLTSITNRDTRFRNFLVSPDWTYFDFSYGQYRQTRNGEYKAADVYYSVIKIKLARPLPNIFFDSKKSRKRQFRFIFKKRQIYHFEGDFDKYFVSYLPQGYELDSLSFVTPDVLQALKDACGYDAEIIGDSFYLYGPIMSANQQLADMSKKALAIKDTLAVTTRNYIDQHVANNLGATEVAPQASALARSRFWLYVHIAAGVTYAIIRIGLAIVHR